MDITRHWRLKSARSQMLATRRPNGEVVLPMQPAQAAQPVGLYVFDTERELLPLSADSAYAHAAR
jgi:hypothetical protein